MAIVKLDKQNKNNKITVHVILIYDLCDKYTKVQPPDVY